MFFGSRKLSPVVMVSQLAFFQPQSTQPHRSQYRAADGWENNFPIKAWFIVLSSTEGTR